MDKKLFTFKQFINEQDDSVLSGATGSTDPGKPETEREAKSRICLLYTSPSPRDRQKARMPSSA